MNCIIVNDASCLIDLRKGRLLHVFLKLPYKFIVPLPVRESELLRFTAQDWQLLDDGGLETFDLPPQRVSEAFAVKGRFPRLSANDCFCFVSTQCHEDAILLTGDGLLRRVSEENGLRVHGVLWVIDELSRVGLCAHSLLKSALETWREDKTVFIPTPEIDRRLKLLS